MATEIVRVLRVIEYIGPRGWVEDIVSRSIQGTKKIGKDTFIRGATIGNYPEILNQQEETKQDNSA